MTGLPILDKLLAHELFGNSAERWLVALAIALLVSSVLVLLKRLLSRRLRDFVSRTQNIVDDLLLDLVRHSRWPSFLALGAYLGSLVLDLNPGLDQALHRLYFVIFFVQIGLWGNHVVGFTIGHYLRRTREQDPARAAGISLISFVARLGIWSIVVLVALDNFGVEVGSVIAGLGIGGIAVGLALQSVLKDTFASIAIILDKPFEVGDFIIVDDMQGKVEHVGVKTTRIRSLGGEELVFGNDHLLSNRIRNFKTMRERRVLFCFAIAFETPNEKVRELTPIVREIVEAAGDTRFDRAYVKEFTDSGLLFEVAYYVLHADFATMTDVRQRINVALHQRLAEEGIRIAYPARRLYVRDAEGTATESVAQLREGGFGQF
ncbi:MAG: mechanosensitive ion channel family protein [Thermoanaerobaculia bacterium]